MTRHALLFTALVFAPAVARAQAPTVTKFSAAGIPVIYKPITANDVITVRVYVRGGSAALTPATAGIERFIAAVASRGTEKYTKDQFNDLATATGTNLDGEVDYDYTVMSLQAVRQHWDQAWDLFTQAVLHPTFPVDEVEQARGQIANNLAQRHDQPDSRLAFLADSVAYVGHPYQVDPEGTTQAIRALTRNDLVAWYRRRLTRANLLVVVVGNLPREDVATRVAAAFGSLPSGTPAPAVPAMSIAAPDVVTVKQDLPTNYIVGVYAAPAPSSPDYAAFRVATKLLQERLFEEVRTKRNLSYAVSASLLSRAANRGQLYVTAVQPDTTLKVMLGEVRRIQQEPVPVSRLGESVNVYLTQLLMGQQSNMGQAADLALWELNGGGWQNASAYRQRLRAVTPADVQRVAKTYLQKARFVVIGDPEKIDRGLFTSL